MSAEYAGHITGTIDVAQLVLYAFWIFFAGLIYYLIRENHREGYPMDNDRGIEMEGWPRAPAPKTYRLADGREIQVPRDEAPIPPDQIAAEPLFGAGGAPLVPTGDALNSGIGPGTWRARLDEPDLDHHGQPKIVPLSSAPEMGVSSRDPDPRGNPVYGADGEEAGTVVDLWVDRGEMLFRYLEVALAGGGRRVLLPMTFSDVQRDAVHVHALQAAQFAGVPATRSATQITLLEEERITAYYGGGLLYATPERAEPLF